ncbi:hypothetical protein H312_03371 [Anncaliia algerae PRA339]|uniref:Uncharacterized protein n=1 Tax=Anncaliia algerae PRA339 TaxID=1288291 RepID=A0A059EW25_9MICR|nr:hypothetical protein H312_03371 [Anncaliia algerae PRA339]
MQKKLSQCICLILLAIKFSFCTEERNIVEGEEFDSFITKQNHNLYLYLIDAITEYKAQFSLFSTNSEASIKRKVHFLKSILEKSFVNGEIEIPRYDDELKYPKQIFELFPRMNKILHTIQMGLKILKEESRCFVLSINERSINENFNKFLSSIYSLHHKITKYDLTSIKLWDKTSFNLLCKLRIMYEDLNSEISCFNDKIYELSNIFKDMLQKNGHFLVKYEHINCESEEYNIFKREIISLLENHVLCFFDVSNMKIIKFKGLFLKMNEYCLLKNINSFQIKEIIDFLHEIYSLRDYIDTIQTLFYLEVGISKQRFLKTLDYHNYKKLFNFLLSYLEIHNELKKEILESEILNLCIQKIIILNTNNEVNLYEYFNVKINESITKKYNEVKNILTINICDKCNLDKHDGMILMEQIFEWKLDEIGICRSKLIYLSLQSIINSSDTIALYSGLKSLYQKIESDNSKPIKYSFRKKRKYDSNMSGPPDAINELFKKSKLDTLFFIYYPEFENYEID